MEAARAESIEIRCMSIGPCEILLIPLIRTTVTYDAAATVGVCYFYRPSHIPTKMDVFKTALFLAVNALLFTQNDRLKRITF